MIWSALSLAGSLLFCATIVLGPLATGNVDGRSAQPGRRAELVELRAKGREPVAEIGKTHERLKAGEDARVVRVAIEAR